MRIAKQRKPLEIGAYYDKVRDADVKCLMVDGKPFGWGVLPESLKTAKSAWKADPTLYDPIMMDIRNHFIKSFAKFLGRNVTIAEINKAIKEGYIEA